MKLESGDTKREIVEFLSECSIETLPGAVNAPSFAQHLGPGLTVYVTSLPNSELGDVIASTRRLREMGFNPVPHVAARNIATLGQLEAFLGRVCGDAGVDDVLVVGGSVKKPVGRYHCTMQLLETGLFDKYGVRRIGVAGHPEGNSDVSEADVMDALARKNDFARRTDAEMYIVTQFCFDAGPVIAWDKAMRASGNKLPIRVGLPGVGSVGSLLKYAKLCGVRASTRILTRRTRDLARLAITWNPDRVVTALAHYKATDPECDIRQAHLYTFGALGRTASWLHAVQDGDFALRKGGEGFTVGERLT